MNIGVSCYPTFGGSGVVAAELGMGLAERGHQVHFITYAVPSRLDVYRPGIFYHEVTVPEYPLFEYAPFSLALASKIAEVTQEHSLQVVHAHYAIPHAASALIARDMLYCRDLRVVTTLHGTDITLVGRDPSFLPVVRASLERADVVTAVSSYLRDEVVRMFGLTRPVHVVHNFIDPRDFDSLAGAEIRRQFSPNGEKLLIHVSNYRKIKRVEDVAAVFLQVRKHVACKLLLVGSGPELPTVEALVRAAGAGRDLILLGSRSRVLDLIAASDLLLLPSQIESFGLAALEAMACGVPPIATRTGGLPEVVEDGVTGCLSEVGDVQDMANKALELLTDSKRYRSVSSAARKRARERFHINLAMDAYEDLYKIKTERLSP